MKALLHALLRYIAQVAASEAGELLSVRRKAHLLQNEMYSRLASEHAAAPRRKVAPLSTTRCPSAVGARRLVPATAGR
ncbi:MAG: hypothetical protein Q8O25_02890 [Sulfurisoma sp.]|nr:hypothetical protein [Sulfurisoma sp.]